MRVALAGLGRMGGALAGRLREAGLELTVYDLSEPVRRQFAADGHRVASDFAAAAAGTDVAMLCLPDAAAVEAAITAPGGLLEASPAPGLCVDLTSSEPAMTRRLGAALAEHGMAMLDVPLSGGVQGAREGRLTAMVGGEEADLERARPLLGTFASTIRWAGPLGSGHAVKAINNALSAASLTATAEMMVTAARCGRSAAEFIGAVNSGPARSQNSEVKFVRDILPRTFAAGFSMGLMHKDIGTACRMGHLRSVPLPLTGTVRELWGAAVAEFGAAADFTRIYEVVESQALPGRPATSDALLEDLTNTVAAACAVAAGELMALAWCDGLDIQRTLEIVNASSGRSEATRTGQLGLSFDQALSALQGARTAAAAAGVPVPLTALVEGLAQLAARRAYGNEDFARIAVVSREWARPLGT